MIGASYAARGRSRRPTAARRSAGGAATATRGRLGSSDWRTVRHEKRPTMHDIAAALASIPPGQRRVAEALIGLRTEQPRARLHDGAPTYRSVADALGL